VIAMTDPMKGVFRGFDIAGAGLRAELQRSEVVASNLGNMHRTGNAKNEPYRRKVLVFDELLEDAARGASKAGIADGSPRDMVAAGVAVSRVAEDQTPFPVFHQPGHPDADESGKVLGSNVDLFQELVDMQVIERSFDANLTALRTYRGMLQNTLTNMKS
jgi:flagellar basal-body rod protein FlgC